jgi:hypothetical protein
MLGQEVGIYWGQVEAVLDGTYSSTGMEGQMSANKNYYIFSKSLSLCVLWIFFKEMIQITQSQQILNMKTVNKRLAVLAKISLETDTLMWRSRHSSSPFSIHLVKYTKSTPVHRPASSLRVFILPTHSRKEYMGFPFARIWVGHLQLLHMFSPM